MAGTDSAVQPPALAEAALVDRISGLIERTRTAVAAQANAALTLMNWHIGHMIDAEVLGRSRAGYDQEIVATLSQQLSWSHIKLLLPVRTAEAHSFYIEQAVAARLSVRALRDLIGRQGFERNEIANAQDPSGAVVPLDSFRDPYLLDFLGLSDAYAEHDLEEAIVHDLQTFLLEVGIGWSFIARQKRMPVGDDDFFLDLLFYSRPLRRLIAVELKVGKFKPSFKGQMDLYLKWLDRYERREGEDAPIGLILCTEASREQIELLELSKDGIVVAEYWTALPPKAELETRITAIYRAARDRLARRELEVPD